MRKYVGLCAQGQFILALCAELYLHELCTEFVMSRFWFLDMYVAVRTSNPINIMYKQN